MTTIAYGQSLEAPGKLLPYGIGLVFTKHHEINGSGLHEGYIEASRVANRGTAGAKCQFAQVG